MKGKFVYRACVLFLIMIFVSCTDVSDKNRIPWREVNIDLYTMGYWTQYGVHTAGMYRVFRVEDRIPASYPFTAKTRTGYGGVLIYNTPYGNVCVFDLSCPVEHKASIRVTFDENTNEAVCSKCGSRYELMEGTGSPISGEAVKDNVWLTKYTAIKTGSGYSIRN